MTLLRPKIGDVFELSVKKGLAYFQILSIVEWCGDFYIRVSKGGFSRRPDNISQVLRKKEQFCAITYRAIKVSPVPVEFVGNYPIPESVNCIPNYFKNKFSGLVFDPKYPPTWTLVPFTNNGKEIILDKILPEEYHDCPYTTICPLNDIVDKINSNWTVYKDIWSDAKVHAWEKKQTDTKSKIREEKSKLVFVKNYFLQCQKLFSFLTETHEMKLEYQGLNGNELSTRFLGLGKSIDIMFVLGSSPCRPVIILEKLAKPRKSIYLQQLFCKYFPDHPLSKEFSEPPKHKYDISILPLYASFLHQKWDEVVELVWEKCK